MIKEQLDSLIKGAMKSENKIELNVYRMIKTKFMEFSTQKNAKELTDAIEISLIQNMIKQRIDAAEQYKYGKREELMQIELQEISVLKQFLPPSITEDQIVEAIKNSDIELITQNMGALIKYVKSLYPTADGKLVSEIVKSTF